MVYNIEDTGAMHPSERDLGYVIVKDGQDIWEAAKMVFPEDLDPDYLTDPSGCGCTYSAKATDNLTWAVSQSGFCDEYRNLMADLGEDLVFKTRIYTARSVNLNR